MRTRIKSRTKLLSGQIVLFVSWLLAHELRNNSIALQWIKCCKHNSTFLDWLFVTLAGNQDRHKYRMISNSGQIRLLNSELLTREFGHSSHFSFLIGSSSYFQVTRARIKPWMCIKSSLIGMVTSELLALER